MSISVESVCKVFGNQEALRSVSFNVNSGELVGFIGPNGAGKSTLMKIICGLLPATGGMVRVNGTDVAKNSLSIRNILGYLPENNPLYPDMYIEEYLNYVSGLYKMRSHKRVHEVIGLTGLSPERHKKIGELSKGYRQRVGLAQAIIHNPEVLILDEPTTGLDPNQIVEIRSLISGLAKEKTVILSTHIMQEVEAICDRVIIISKGQIMADDLTGNMGKYSLSPLHTIVVEFSEDPGEDVFSVLSGIDLTRKLSDKTWLIQTSGNFDIREDLFKMAVKKGLVILSMHRKDRKLEDVFRELTT
jgi:ABC-2 type transport system ATP-binding protein